MNRVFHQGARASAKVGIQFKANIEPPPPQGAGIGTSNTGQLFVAPAMQGGLGAVMGNHELFKAAGWPLGFDVNLSVNAEDLNGSPVAWPYRLVVELGRPNNGVWLNSGQIGFPDSGRREIALGTVKA